jgi:hypothetical protein
MLLLPKKEAIIYCKEIWADIKQSSVSKDEYFRNEKSKYYLLGKTFLNFCPLCEYTKYRAVVFKRYVVSCDICPLVQQYGLDCYELGFSHSNLCSTNWYKAIEDLIEE